MRSRRDLATLTVASELLPLLREVLGRGGHLPLVARGDSMCPALRSGDRLTLGPVRLEELRPGDIVLWSHRERVVIHRIVDFEGSDVVTRGDAVEADDGRIPRAAILARVVRTERDHGRIGRVVRLLLRGSRLHGPLRAVLRAGRAARTR